MEDIWCPKGQKITHDAATAVKNCRTDDVGRRRRQATSGFPQGFSGSCMGRWFAFYGVIFAWPDNYCDMPIITPWNGSQRLWRAFSAIPDAPSNQTRRRGCGDRRRKSCPVSSKSKSIRFYIHRSYFPEARLRDIPGSRIAGISIWGRRIELISEVGYAYWAFHGFIVDMSYRNYSPLSDSCRSWRNLRLSFHLQVKG